MSRDGIRGNLFRSTITGFIVWTLIGFLWATLIVITHRDSYYYFLDLPLFRLLDGLEVERVSLYKLYVPILIDQVRFLFDSTLYHSVFGLISGIVAAALSTFASIFRKGEKTGSDSRPFLISWNLFFMITFLLASTWQFTKKGSFIPQFIPIFLSLKVIAALILALTAFYILKRILSQDAGDRSSRNEISAGRSRSLFFLCVFLICVTGIWSYLGERSVIGGRHRGSGSTLLEKDPEEGPGGNIILIIIDTLRADHLGCYGYERPITPNIDRLAGDGIRFSTCISQAPWTIPSIMAIMTSMYPSVNGVMDNKSRLDPMRVTLAEAFREGGYRTAGLVSHTYVDNRFGFADGFDIFEDQKVIHRPAEEITDLAISTLEEMIEERFFLFIHYFDPHFPYDPPAPYDTLYQANLLEEKTTTWNKMKRFAHVKNPLPPEDLDNLIALYDGEIAYNDEMIGKLIDYLKSSGIYNKTTIVLTADHGEEFKDHGSVGHTRTLYDEVVHVPLLVKLPGSENRGMTVEDQVRSIDIAPTLLGIAGVGTPIEFQGTDLSPLWTEDDVRMALPAFSETSRHAILRSIRTDDRKYIQNFRLSFYHTTPGDKREHELYNLRTDPEEKRDQADTESPSLSSLMEELFQWSWTSGLEREWLPREGGIEDVTFDQETQDRLRALGYVQ